MRSCFQIRFRCAVRTTLTVKVAGSCETSVLFYQSTRIHIPEGGLHLQVSLQNLTFLGHHHHHLSFLELGHVLTRSGLTYPEVSSEVYHDSFCQLGSNVSLPWVICFEAFYLHVVSSFSCIPVICPKLVLFLTPLQFVHLFCNLSK